MNKKNTSKLILIVSIIFSMLVLVNFKTFGNTNVNLLSGSNIISDSSTNKINLKTLELKLNTAEILTISSTIKASEYTYILEDKSGDLEITPNLAKNEIKVNLKSGNKGSVIFSLKKGNEILRFGFIAQEKKETNVKVTKIEVTPIYSGDRRYLVGNVRISEKANVVINVLNTKTGEVLGTYLNKNNDLEYYFDRNITGIENNTELELQIIANGKKIETLGLSGEKIESSKKDFKIIMNNRKIVINNLIQETNVKVTRIEVTPIYSGNRRYLVGNVKISEKANVVINVLNTKTGEILGTYLNKNNDLEYYFDRNITGIENNTELELQVIANGKKIETLGLSGEKIESSKKDFKITMNNRKIVINNLIQETNVKVTKIEVTPIYSGDRRYLVGNVKISEKANIVINVLNTKTGEVLGTYLNKNNDLEYYFDRNITGIENNTELELQVIANGKKIETLGLSGEKIESSKKDFKITMNNRKIVINNLIQETNVKVTKIEVTPIYSGDRRYLVGNVKISEKANVVINVLNTKTGEILGTYLNKNNDLEYYFDRNITGIENNTELELQVIANGKKIETLGLSGEKTESSKKDFKIIMDNRKIVINTINTNLITSVRSSINNFELIKSGNLDYLIANLSIYTNNGTENKELINDNLKLELKSSDNKKYPFYVKKENGNRYYIDRNITGIDISKEYEIIVTINNKEYNVLSNISDYIITSQIENKGHIKNSKLKISNSINITRNVTSLNVIKSGLKDYITGYLEIYELRNNKKFEIQDINNIYIKDKNGNRYPVHISREKSKGEYIYYFDRNITGMKLPEELKLEYDGLQFKISNISNQNSLIKANILWNKIILERQQMTSGVYGKSGRGRDLRYYKLGNGNNVFFATFAVHGWEDNFRADGASLVYIADEFKKILNTNTYDYLNDWTIYIFPEVNPDAIVEGYTNNGPGRTTITSDFGKGVDLNRVWQINDNYKKFTSDRNYNGNYGFGASEARHLRDFLLNNQSKTGKNILVDLHGWLESTIGDNELGSYYRNEYNMSSHISSYGDGYLVNWAKSVLNNARSVLVELPRNVLSHQDVLNQNLAGKFINATLNILKNMR